MDAGLDVVKSGTGEFHADQQTAAADFQDLRVLDLAQAGHEVFALFTSLLGIIISLQDLQRLDAAGAGQRVAAKGGAVGTRSVNAQDVVIGSHSGQRHYAAAQSLAQDEDVGLHGFVLHGEHIAGAGKTGLDFVGHEQDIVLGADLPHFLQITRRRHDDAGFALDGFSQESHGVFGDGGFQSGGVAVRDHLETGSVRSVIVLGQRIIGEADDGDGAAMEIVFANNDLLLAVFHAFDLGAPAAGSLQSGLNGLGAGVHGQNHVLAGGMAQGFIKIAQDGVVESAAGQSYFIQLILGRGHDLRVTVSEIVSGVSGQHVIILASFRIVYFGAFRLDDDHILGMIVMSAVFVGLVDDLLSSKHLPASLNDYILKI